MQIRDIALKEYVNMLEAVIVYHEETAEICGQEGEVYLYEESRKAVEKLKAVHTDLNENYHLYRHCTGFQFVNLLNEKGILQEFREALPSFIRKIDADIEKLLESKTIYSTLLEIESVVPTGGIR